MILVRNTKWRVFEIHGSWEVPTARPALDRRNQGLCLLDDARMEFR